MVIKSEFLQSLFDLVPPCNEKLNTYSILSILDKIDDYGQKEFYDDVRIVLDATTGKKISIERN